MNLKEINDQFLIKEDLEFLETGHPDHFCGEFHHSLFQFNYWKEKSEWISGTFYSINRDHSRAYRYIKNSAGIFEFQGTEVFTPVSKNSFSMNRFNQSGEVVLTYNEAIHGCLDEGEGIICIKHSDPEQITYSGTYSSENEFIESYRSKWESFLYGYVDKPEKITFYLRSEEFLND